MEDPKQNKSRKKRKEKKKSGGWGFTEEREDNYIPFMLTGNIPYSEGPTHKHDVWDLRCVQR